VNKFVFAARPTERGVQPGRRPGVHEFKHVESCFLDHNSSIHFCCTDSLLMTPRGGLSLSIIIWRIGGGGPGAPSRLNPPLSGPGSEYKFIHSTLASLLWGTFYMIPVGSSKILTTTILSVWFWLQ
jgi:hypothetical protein